MNTTLKGKIEEVKFSHRFKDYNVYECRLSVKRNSGVIDFVPFCTIDNIMEGMNYVKISGDLRTHTYFDGDGNRHKKMLVRAENIESVEDSEKDENLFKSEAVLLKVNPLRKTPFGREICDCMLAINYSYNKSAYVNAIVWGRLAKEVIAKNLVGSKKVFTGRIQSRDYLKNGETKTTYELSISKIEDIDDTRSN